MTGAHDETDAAFVKSLRANQAAVVQPNETIVRLLSIIDNCPWCCSSAAEAKFSDDAVFLDRVWDQLLEFSVRHGTLPLKPVEMHKLWVLARVGVARAHASPAACSCGGVAWQSIETAPKERVNGILQQVLLIGKYPSTDSATDLVQSWWVPPVCGDEKGEWARWKHDFPPTHWMPSIAPPGAAHAPVANDQRELARIVADAIGKVEYWARNNCDYRHAEGAWKAIDLFRECFAAPSGANPSTPCACYRAGIERAAEIAEKKAKVFVHRVNCESEFLMARFIASDIRRAGEEGSR